MVWQPGSQFLRDKLPTPDTAPGLSVCRTLRFPSDTNWAALINGVLSLLMYPENFRQEGTVTPAETAQTYSEMMLKYWESSACMLGMIAPFHLTDLPDGWIKADGSTYARADYPDLWEVWPDILKDATTLTTVNLGSRMLMVDGEGDGLTPRVIGDIGGEETHQLTIPEMPTHQHNYWVPGAVSVPAGELVPVPVASQVPTSMNTGDTGGNGHHENMPPFITPCWGILAR